MVVDVELFNFFHIFSIIYGTLDCFVYIIVIYRKFCRADTTADLPDIQYFI